jgi:hypothetical protein
LSTVSNYWIYTTVLIANEWGTKGTGFLAGNQKNDKTFLVTNKHIISNDESKRETITKLTLWFNRENEPPVKQELDLLLEEQDRKLWREHPDKYVDVLAFDLTQILNSKDAPLLRARATRHEYFLTPEITERLDVKISDEILVIGYPGMFGLKNQISNLPIVRQGIIASNIGENLEDWGYDNNERDKKVLRAFLIDGVIIPSSGSPVILKPTLGRYIKNVYLVQEFQPVLLGILSEMRHAIIPDRISDFKALANLGIVYNADTIKETIELFDQ